MTEICGSCGGEPHSGPCLDPAPPHRRSIDDATGEEWNAASRQAFQQAASREGSSAVAYREGVVYIADVPAGAQLLMYNGRAFVVGPGMEPSWVTPTGLQPLEFMGVKP